MMRTRPDGKTVRRWVSKRPAVRHSLASVAPVESVTMVFTLCALSLVVAMVSGCSDGAVVASRGSVCSTVDSFPDDLNFEQKITELRNEAAPEPCRFAYEVGSCGDGSVLFVRLDLSLSSEVFYYDATTGQIVGMERWIDLGAALCFWPERIVCEEPEVTQEICTRPFDLFVD